MRSAGSDGSCREARRVHSRAQPICPPCAVAPTSLATPISAEEKEEEAVGRERRELAAPAAWQAGGARHSAMREVRHRSGPRVMLQINAGVVVVEMKFIGGAFAMFAQRRPRAPRGREEAERVRRLFAARARPRCCRLLRPPTPACRQEMPCAPFRLLPGRAKGSAARRVPAHVRPPRRAPYAPSTR